MANTQEFDRIIDTLPTLLKNLQSSPAITREELSLVPERGIYVFYEEGKPIYVGRSKHMRSRLLEHSRTSSDRYSATFAFRLAQEEATRQGIDCKSMKKAELERDDSFRPLFLAARQRVAKMNIRVVQVDGPVEQTIFEVYAARALDTPYNDFETH